MISITLFVSGNELTIPFPEEWNELTPDELRFCINGQVNENSKPKIFVHLLSSSAARNKIKLPKNWQYSLNKEQAAIASIDCLNFLYDENNLTKSPFPELKIGKKIFKGPTDEFENLTCGQMELCYPALERFKESTDLKYLFELNSYLFNCTIDEIKKVDVDILLCMYTWFAGCLSILPQIFPNLYEGNAAEEFDYIAFTKLIHAGAGDRNGTRKEIREMPIKEFQFDLELLAIEAKKQENAINNTIL